MDSWKGSRLELVEHGEHEVLMESDAIQREVFDGLEKLFLGTVAS
jgi:lysophospholipase